MRASIVIPTFNRANLLRSTLTALATQQAKDVGFEVIIVDHGSTDNTQEQVRQLEHRLAVNYMYLEHTVDCINQPRNVGWRAARHELILFLDAGMLVPPDFVAAHLLVNERSRGRSVGIGLCYGQYREDSFWLPKINTTAELVQLATVWDSDSSIRDPRALVDWASTADPWVYVGGGNLSLSQTMLRAVGGFDEEMTGWGFEDLELGYRLHEFGASFCAVPGGWSVHLPHARHPLSDRISQAFRNWRYAYRKHPTLSMEAFGAASMDLDMHKVALRDLEMAIRAYQESPHLQHERDVVFRLLTKRSANETILIVGLSHVLQNEQEPSSHNRTVVGIWSPDSIRTVHDEKMSKIAGVQLPMDDNAYDLAIVTSFWQFLYKAPRSGLPPYLRLLIRDLRRVVRRAIFLHNPDLPATQKELFEMAKLEDVQIPVDLYTVDENNIPK